MTSSSFTRRRFLVTTALASVTGTAALAAAPAANAQRRAVGTILDYSAGVPSGRSVKAAGHLGAIRYVSRPRPDAAWMKGKPVALAETQDFKSNGLATASIYQFGRANTADWLGGAGAAAIHAPQAIAIHKAAGGPTGRPIYIAIDDNPSKAQYDNQIRPYLQAFGSLLTAAGYSTGVYGNYSTIEWASADGIGSFFWMHDWGSGGRLHPRANIHQVARWQTTIDGVECDINNVYTTDWGQWTPGSAASGPSQPTLPINEIMAGSSQLSSQATASLDQALNQARKFLP